MKALFNLPVFYAGGIQYYWEDVVLAAIAWGDWTVLKEEVRKGLACAKRMRNTGESPTGEEINAEIRRFRCEHELITTEEVVTWLKQWGLNTADWLKYISMFVLKKKWTDQLYDIVSNFPVTDQEVDLNIKAEVVCSGQLVSFCRKLASRLSIYEKQKEEAAIAGFKVPGRDGLKALLEIFNENLKKSGGRHFPPGACRKKLETLACIDLYFQHFCKQVFTPRAIKEQIRIHNFDWIRIDCLHLSFQEEQIAREVILCIKEDGEEFSAVAARLNSQIQKNYYYLDRVDSSLHTHFLHAQRGELIGPLDLAGKPTLFLVCEKIMPSEKDPYIKERAKERILKDTIEHELLNRIRWETGFL